MNRLRFDLASAKTLVLALTLMMVVACRSKPTEPPSEPPMAAPAPPPSSSSSSEIATRAPIAIDPAEGWGGDVQVPSFIASIDGQVLMIRARATVDGEAVDLDVVFDESAHSVELRPTGPGADRLLAAIAHAWKLPASTGKMRRVTAPAAWLRGHAPDARSSPILTKAFFLEDAGDEAELYVNWNPTTSMLELYEKDEGYREGVLRSLTGS